MRRPNLVWEVLIPQALTLVVAVHIDEVGGVYHHSHASLILNHEGFAVVGAKLHRQGRGVHHNIAQPSRRSDCLDSSNPVYNNYPILKWAITKALSELF